MHEAIGHYGLSNLMGEKFAALQSTVLQKARTGRELSRHPQPGEADYATVEAVRRLYPEASDSEVAQEVLARMAEMMEPPGWSKILFAQVRHWLRTAARAMNLTVEPSLQEAKDAVVLAAKHLRDGKNLEREMAGDGQAFASEGAPRLAPNGKPSRLNAHQWKQVRTPEFKAWFGDWEAASLKTRIMASPISVASTAGLTESGSYKDLRTEAKALYRGPAVVTNAETHEAIRIEDSGLENALQHGMNIQKRAVIAVLDKMLEGAAFVVRDTENMRPGVAAVETFAARVSIDDAHFVARLVVREVADGRRFYDHELSTLEMESARPTSNSGGSASASADRQSEPRPLVSLGKRILAQALAVNPDSVSKVVDENGEPLVVYHGTQGDFSEFDPQRAGQNFDDVDERGMLFSSKVIEPNMMAERGDGYGGNVISTYLAMRNPLIVEFDAAVARRRFGVASATSWYDNNKALILRSADRGGHDGIIIRSPEYEAYRAADTYVAFRPEQIKSAIGNRGTFDDANPNILESRSSGPAQWQSPEPSRLDDLIYSMQDKHAT
jgi:hypothetical protein